jgi:hypothetical protein
MEYFIDLAGRSRKVRRRNVAAAVAEVGYVHIRTRDVVQRDRSTVDRTVIVTLRPQLPSELTLAATGYKLSDLDPDRIVVVADSASPECWVFDDVLPAMRRIAAIASGDGISEDRGSAREYLL